MLSAVGISLNRANHPIVIGIEDEVVGIVVMRCQRRYRTKFTKVQIAILEECFLREPYITATTLADLSSKLTLGTTQVKIWFKNRRRRQKIRSTKKYNQLKDNSKTTNPTASKSLSWLNDNHLECNNNSSASLSGSANNSCASNEEFAINLYQCNQCDSSLHSTPANALPEHNYRYATTTAAAAAPPPPPPEADATALFTTAGYQQYLQTVGSSVLPTAKCQRLQVSLSSHHLSETATNKPETDYCCKQNANCKHTMSLQPFKVQSAAVKISPSEMAKSKLHSSSICDGNGVNRIDFDNKMETNTKPSAMLDASIDNNITNSNMYQYSRGSNTSNHDCDNNNSNCSYNTFRYAMEDCSKANMKLHRISFDEIFAPSYAYAWDGMISTDAEHYIGYDPMQQFACY